MAVVTLTITQNLTGKAPSQAYSITLSPTSISYNPGDTLSIVTNGTGFNGSTGVIIYFPDGTIDSTERTRLSTRIITTATTTNLGSFVGVAGTGVVNIQTYNGNVGVSPGNVNINFTGSGDSTPNAFSFTDKTTGVVFSTQYTSSITLGGLGTSNKCVLYCSGGEFKINSGAYIPGESYGCAGNNDVITVRARSGVGYEIETIATLYAFTLAGTTSVSDNFIIDTGSPSGATYGFEVYNSSGNKTLAVDSYQARYVQQGVAALDLSNPSGSPAVISDTVVVSVPGMTNTDTWQVLYTASFSAVEDDNAILTVTKGTNQLTIFRQETVPANTTDSSLNDVSYTIFNIG